MQPNDIVNIISDLNYNLWENLKTPDDFVKTEFVYSTNGSVDVVKVADTVIVPALLLTAMMYPIAAPVDCV